MRRLFQFPWRSRRQIRMDVDDELRFHIEARAADLVTRDGLTREAAQARAQQEFGDLNEARRSINRLDRAAEAARRRKDYLGAVWQDLAYAFRTLKSAPGFSLTVVLTLALGIGATTAIVSVAYGVLLRPLQYRDPGSLVIISAERTFAGQVRPANYSAGELVGWQQRGSAFESIGMWASMTYRVRSEAGTQTVGAALVSDGFFSTLDEGLAQGRALGPPDARSNVAVISHNLWRHRFLSDARILGQTVTLNDHPYVVIGVTRSDFSFPSENTDVWTPLGYAQGLGQERWAIDDRGGFELIARLRPGATLSTARQNAVDVARALASESPKMSAGRRPIVTGLVEWFTDSARPALLMLVAAVGLVLAVACANAMNLLLARQASRTHELSIRASLGASPARLMSAAMAESVLLSLAGGLLGVIMAMIGVRAFVSLWPASLPRADAIQVDRPILIFALALSLGTALVCGLAPAVRCLRYGLAAGPRPGGFTQSRAARRVRSALVVAQLAASVILLIGAGLFGRSLAQLLHSEIGIKLDDVVVAEMKLGYRGASAAAAQVETVARVLEKVALIPGVQRAGVATSLPLNGPRLRYTLKDVVGPEGRARDYDVHALATTPAFFSALGVPLLQGRFFTDADTKTSPPVMIMSAHTARLFFGERDPIGRVLTLPSQGPSGREDVTLVGVVGDIKYNKTLDAPADGGVYRPFGQQPWSFAYLVVQTPDDPAAVVGALRKTVAEVDPEIALDGVRNMRSALSDAISEPRFRTLLLSALAVLALALASIGLYGAMSYSVSVRTTEVGIRMALGAGAGNVTAMVVRQGLQLACLGAVIGVAGALALARVVQGLLYGVAPTDPVSLIAAPVGLLIVAAVASFIPARRAAAVDPIVALRSE